ncbi:hypothetical protein EZS27_029557 [termite gut metagenome]|jgi:hypothetical protein|uniref:Uncharacterized protein n=1 Tax=termite gut metagenome TaxID=433724 RepID=A0A5J4QIM0_9ZZZZ
MNMKKLIKKIQSIFQNKLKNNVPEIPSLASIVYDSLRELHVNKQGTVTHEDEVFFCDATKLIANKVKEVMGKSQCVISYNEHGLISIQS